MRKSVLIASIISAFLVSCGGGNNDANNNANSNSDTTSLNLNEKYEDKKETVREYVLTGNVDQDVLNYMIPEGLIQGDLMRVKYSDERYVDIVTRLQNNSQQDKEWFKEFYKQGKEQGVVEYNPKMGITEEEFNYMTSYKGEFVKIGELELTAKINGGSVYINCNKLADFDSIRFDMKNKYVVFNNIACQYQGTFEVIDNKFPGGLKKGHMWRYQYFGPSDQRIEQIYELRLAELKGTGDIMMYLGVHDINGDKAIDKEYVVIYPTLLNIN